MDLKAETIGLAAMLELPMVIVDVQRAGPSTGMPTKTEQGDLLMAIHGRHGESPLPVFAPSTPADCFDDGGRGGPHRGPLPDAGDPARRHLPRQLLGALADPRQLPTCRRSTPTSPTAPNTGDEFLPYLRDERGARPWAIPGHARPPAPARRPREGGRQRQHQLRPRQPRADDRSCARRSSRSWPRSSPSSRSTPTRAPSCWCSAGARPTASIRRRRPAGAREGHPDRDRPPAPRRTRCRRNTGEVVRRFPKVLIPELNTGQLLSIIRARVPRRRDRLQQNRGPADPRRGDGAGDPGGIVMSENGQRATAPATAAPCRR